MNEENTNKHSLDTAIQNVRSLRMAADERARILERIHSTAPAQTGAEKILGEPVAAERPSHSPIKMFLMIAGILAALVLLVGGGLATASGDALPGDLFYPMKVGFFEPIRSSLAGTGASLASVEADLVNTRLSEAETLATAGKLNDAKREQIEALLNKHTIVFDQALTGVQGTSPQKASALATAMQATFQLHAELMSQFTVYASTTGSSTAAANADAIEHLKKETDLHVVDPRAPWVLPVPATTSSDFIIQNFSDKGMPAAVIEAATASSSLPDRVPAGKK
jgi:hypothetical protein